LDQPSNDLSWHQANFWSDEPAGNGIRGKPLGRTTKVGSYGPNRLGLHDMHGNVRQWCMDLHGGGPNRMTRGGSWNNFGRHCRAATRVDMAPSLRDAYLGFRLARVPPGGKQ
jgi:formylglycine-generating enzyme required for sulfatase activity